MAPSVLPASTSSAQTFCVRGARDGGSLGSRSRFTHTAVRVERHIIVFNNEFSADTEALEDTTLPGKPLEPHPSAPVLNTASLPFPRCCPPSRSRYAERVRRFRLGVRQFAGVIRPSRYALGRGLVDRRGLSPAPHTAVDSVTLGVITTRKSVYPTGGLVVIARAPAAMIPVCRWATVAAARCN